MLKWKKIHKKCYNKKKGVKKLDSSKSSVVYCCVFQPAFGCCAHPKAGQNHFLAVFNLFCSFQSFFSIFTTFIQTLIKGFIIRKAHFHRQKRWTKNFSPSDWVQAWKTIFFTTICLISSSFSSFFYIFHVKNIKKHILTSNCSAQHPNAGWNIHQSSIENCLQTERYQSNCLGGNISWSP